MRLLLIVLLLANLALLLYVLSEDKPLAPLPSQVAADKIELLRPLAEGEPIPTPSPKQATPCLEWGPVADAQLDNARAALNHIPEIGTYREIRRQGPARSWLVSLDGFNNRTAATTRSNELRRQGISDISVLEPSSETASTFALSLGVFSSEQGAQTRAASLDEKKIGGVKITPRGGIISVFFVVSNASPAQEKHLRELSPRFADSTVQNVSCPPPNPAE